MSDTMELSRRFFDEICNKRDRTVADHLFSAGHVYHDPSSPSIKTGPAGMKDLIATYHNAVADAHWDVQAMMVSGDTVITRWTGRGTHTGELMGIPATHRKVKIDGIWMHRIAGGRIVESWNCWDTLGMLQQLGVIPAMGAAKAA